jgi:hypothetical protein
MKELIAHALHQAAVEGAERVEKAVLDDTETDDRFGKSMLAGARHAAHSAYVGVIEGSERRKRVAQFGADQFQKGMEKGAEMMMEAIQSIKIGKPINP